MRYAPHLLDEILRRVDIVQLVGRRVKLTRKGGAFWGCCPFHKEKSASFKVENARRTYKCFGCGKGGDAFKWLMETEGLSFPEAVEKLASEAGVVLPKATPQDAEREEKRKSLYDVVEAAAVFYETCLFSPTGEKARQYLKSRGLDGAAAKRFRLGYAPSGNGLLRFLQEKQIPTEDILAAGLARPADENRPLRDFFYDRLMFPITDGRGRLIAFGGRALMPDAKPKYINTGETVLFSKGHQLYNFANARSAAIRSQTIILCEGYMDVIALVRAGFEAAVAPLGTALTEDQLQLLWRTAPEPIVTFDGDEAGMKAAARAAHLALPHLKPGYSLRFAFLPPPEDPDSLIRSAGPAAMQAVLDKAEPLAELLWRLETENKDLSTPERRAGLERQMADLVGQIGDEKVAEYYKRDFDERIFQNFKRRRPRDTDNREGAAPRSGGSGNWNGPGGNAGRRGGKWERPAPFVPVSDAVRNSLLARAKAEDNRNPIACKVKETEVCRHLLAAPELVLSHAETLAALPFSDPLLDRFRHEILNLAASDNGLEASALNDHFTRLGMSGLLTRLQPEGRDTAPEPVELVDRTQDVEAKFLCAAAELRELAELKPERAKANDRFKALATEESWREYLNLRRH